MGKKYTIIGATLIVFVVAYFFFIYKKNYEIPSKNQMVNVLSDVYLIDAIGQARGNLQSLKGKDAYMEKCYHTLLAKYGITKADFDSAIVWYSHNPEEYAEIYEKVIENLSKRESYFSRIITQRDSIKELIKSKRDSLTLHIWKYPKSFFFRLPRTEHDTFPKDLSFKFKTDSLVGGKMTLRMDYNFPYRNQSTEATWLQMLCHYNDTTIDTINITLKKEITTQRIEHIYNVRNKLGLRNVDLCLLKSKDFKNVVATLMNVDLIYIPYEITDSVKFDEISIPPLFAY